MRNRFLFIGMMGMVLFGPLHPPVSMGQEFPTRPLQLVVTFPAGGSVDVIARILSPRLSEHLGKPVTVLNKPGAAGAVAFQFVAGSKPDGYTFVMSTPNLVTIPHITPNVTFSYRSFQPIRLTTMVPYILVVDAKSNWKSIKDLVEYGRKNPEKLNHGGAGAGAVSTFMGDWFSVVAGIQITQIPYVGEAPALLDLIGGRTHFNCCSVSSAINYIKSGQLRTLAVMTAKRYKGLKDVPAIGEEGYPDCAFNNWHMALVPANTPRQAVDKLNEAFQKVLREEDIIKSLENLAAVVENLGPEESAKVLKEDDEKWATIIKRVGSEEPKK